MKKTIMVVMIALAAVGLFAGGAGEKSVASTGPEPIVVGMVAEGLGTQSFNDDVKDGLDAIGREFQVRTIAIELANVTDIANSLRTLIMQGANIIIVPSASYADGMLEIAAESPNVKFFYPSDILIGYDNIMSFDYAEHEGAYLMGMLAGMLTKTNNVGAVLAVRGDIVQERYQYGFTAGVKTVNPACQVQIAYTNSYTDINKGNEVAVAMYSKGADIVGTYAGACNLGVFNAARSAGKDKYCFGAAKGQFEQLPEKIIASLVKPIDIALLNVVGDYIRDGIFVTDKAMKLGLANQGVVQRFTPLNDSLLAMVTPQMHARLDQATEQISRGELVVPYSQATYDAFVK